MSHWESASINISYYDFTKICRICLARDNLRTLQEVEYLIDLLQIITAAGAEVREDDGLPQNICNNCIIKLEEISDFIDLAKFNDSCLRHVYLTKVNLKTNTVAWSLSSSTNNNQENYTEEVSSSSNNSTENDINNDSADIIRTDRPQKIIGDNNTEPFISNNGMKRGLEPPYERITSHKSMVHVEVIEPDVVKLEIPDDPSAESETSSHNRDCEIETYGRHSKNMSPEEYRRLRRRELNRRAAEKCRKRTRDKTNKLVNEMTQLETFNVSLKSQVKALEEEKGTLLKTLSRFKCTAKHLTLLEQKSKNSLH